MTAVMCPPELAPLHGILAQRADDPFERMEQSAASQELTEQVDQVPWETWIGSDPRLLATGDVDGCGCPIMHWTRSDNSKSATLHIGCEMGYGAHIWSGTMMADLGLDGHTTRLNLAAALAGETIQQAAARVGIRLGERDTFTAITPISLRAEADDAEAAGDLATAKRKRAAADVLEADGARVRAALVGLGQSVAQPEIRFEGSFIGAPVGESGDVPAGEDEAADAMDFEAAGSALYTEMMGIEERMREYRGSVPVLGRVFDLAESRGVHPIGLLAAILPRVAALVPPNVVIVPAGGVPTTKAEGLSLNIFVVLVGPAATGKTTTDGAARGAVPLPSWVTSIPDGTAEGIAKSARATDKKGRPVVLSTSVLVLADEIDTVLQEIDRRGSKFGGFIRGAWFTGGGGQMTSDHTRRSVLPAHGTRIGGVIGAQPELVKPILDEGQKGTPQRFLWLAVGSLDEDELGPLFGKPVAPILDPMHPSPLLASVSGTVLPESYQRPVGPQRTGADTSRGDDDEDGDGVPHYDDAPPIWIHRPAASRAAFSRSRSGAARRSKNWRRASTENRERPRGWHDGVMQIKIAAVLAIADGLSNPLDAHWHVAGLLLEAQALVLAEARVLSERYHEQHRSEIGRLRGFEFTGTRAGQAVAAGDAAAETARLILITLHRHGGSARRGQCGGQNLRTSLRGHRDPGIEYLRQEGLVTVTGFGGNRDQVTVTAEGAAKAQRYAATA